MGKYVFLQVKCVLNVVLYSRKVIHLAQISPQKMSKSYRFGGMTHFLVIYGQINESGPMISITFPIHWEQRQLDYSHAATMCLFEEKGPPRAALRGLE